jgi:hypothetical protein
MKTTSIWVLVAVAALAVAAPTASEAKPQATCKAMCQRLTDCKLPSYTKMCLDSCKQYQYEATEEGRAQLLTLTRYSCKQIQSALGATDVHQHQPASTRSPAPPSPSPRRPSARPPAPQNPQNDDFADDDDYDATGRGQRSYQADSGSDSSDTSCSWVCRRLTECKLTTARRCGEMCSMAASNGQPLRIGRESCPEIRKAFVSTKWTCWAEGSSGYAYGNGPWTYRNTSIPANGRTRDEAALEAARGCNALMSTGNNTSSLSGAAVDRGDCKVTKCFPPGSPLF